MKRILPALLFLFFSASLCCAQSTTVSGTVTDAGSQTWNNGTITFSFTPNPQYPVGPYTWTGGTLQNTISGALSGTGTYSLSIPSNSAISPIGTSWTIKVCPLATSPCFTQSAVTITGTTQTVNITPPAILINLQQPPASPPLAYSTSEITGAAIDSAYYNLTLQVEQYCSAVSGNTCTTWVTRGSGAPGGLPTLDQVLNQVQNKTFNQGGSTIGFTGGPGMNLSGETTAMTVPVIAGCTPSANGQICFDATGLNFVGYNGGVNVFPLAPTTVVNGDLAGFLVSGGKITFQDLGPLGGGGGGSGGFIKVVTTNIQDGDSVCWDAGTSQWVNCTEGVPVTKIAGTTHLVDCVLDRGAYLLFSSSSPISVTIPQASNTGVCDANFFTYMRTLNADLTITPTVSTIDDGGGAGASTTIHASYGTNVFSDNANYFAKLGPYRKNPFPLFDVEGYDLGPSGVFQWQSPNNTVSGTILDKMACNDGTSKEIICSHTTSTTNSPDGVAVSGVNATPGTSGKTAVCDFGFCTVFFDNSATANDYAQSSSTTDGDLHDVGATIPTNGQPYWHITTSNSGANTTGVIRILTFDEVQAASVNSGGKTTVQVNGTSTQPVANIVNGTGITFAAVNSGNTTTITPTVTVSGPTTNQNIREVNAVFDGGGSALSGTTTRCRQVNFAGTIQEFSAVGDQSGSATVKVLTVAFASYTGPGSASDITGGGESLSSVTKLQDSTLTGWTTSLSANTVVCMQVSSPSTFTWLSANIKVAAN